MGRGRGQGDSRNILLKKGSIRPTELSVDLSEGNGIKHYQLIDKAGNRIVRSYEDRKEFVEERVTPEQTIRFFAYRQELANDLFGDGVIVEKSVINKTAEMTSRFFLYSDNQTRLIRGSKDKDEPVYINKTKDKEQIIYSWKESGREYSRIKETEKKQDHY